jgi:transcriptional activator SPT7
MLESLDRKSPRIPKRKRIPVSNGHSHINGQPKTPPLDHSRAVDLGGAIYRSVDKLNEARKVQGLIHDWQKAEIDGAALPPSPAVQFAAIKAQARIEKRDRKRSRAEAAEEASKRRKIGQEVGEKEAAYTLKKASAGLLAHAGFEGESPAGKDPLGHDAHAQVPMKSHWTCSVALAQTTSAISAGLCACFRMGLAVGCRPR